MGRQGDPGDGNSCPHSLSLTVIEGGFVSQGNLDQPGRAAWSTVLRMGLRPQCSAGKSAAVISDVCYRSRRGEE